MHFYLMVALALSAAPCLADGLGAMTMAATDKRVEPKIVAKKRKDAALPKARPERKKNVIDFHGERFLYFKLSEEGKTPSHEFFNGFLDKAHAAAANLAAYQTETREEVRAGMHTGGSIIATFEAVVLEPAPDNKIKIFLEMVPYEAYLGTVDSNYLLSDQPESLNVPPMGGSNAVGGGNISGNIQLRWNKESGTIDVLAAQINITVSLTGLGTRTGSTPFKDLKSELSYEGTRRPKPLDVFVTPPAEAKATKQEEGAKAPADPKQSVTDVMKRVLQN